MADYEHSGKHVVAASPSCGVATTLDVDGACDALRTCPLARLDSATVTRQVVADHAVPGRGMFMGRALARRGLSIPFAEHSFPEDFGSGVP